MIKHTTSSIFILCATFLTAISCNKDEEISKAGKGEITFKTNAIEKTYEIKHFEGGSASQAVILALSGIENASPYLIDLIFFKDAGQPTTGIHSISAIESNDGKIKCTLNHAFSELGVSQYLAASSGEVNFIQFKSQDKKASLTFDATFYELNSFSQPLEDGQTNIKISAKLN